MTTTETTIELDDLIDGLTENSTPTGTAVAMTKEDGTTTEKTELDDFPGGGSSTDTDAVHVNVAAEISAITEKVTPIDADMLIIEDSADSDNKKMIEIGNLPSSGGGAKPDFIASFPAGSVDYIGGTTDANWKKLSLTNRKVMSQVFDDTTEWFWISDFTMPDNDTFTGSDNVTFKIRGLAETWVTGKKVAFKVYYGTFAGDEDLDVALTSFKASGDLTVTTGGQDYQDEWTFTETLTTLGWVAGDKVAIMLGKPQASADQLSDDYYQTDLDIIIPRT